MIWSNLRIFILSLLFCYVLADVNDVISIGFGVSILFSFFFLVLILNLFVRMQKSNCPSGTCPVYTVTFTRNSNSRQTNASYTGLENAPRKGNYASHISETSFNDLAKLLLDKDFFEFNGTYGDDPNSAEVIVTATISSGGETTSKQVSDRNSGYPPLTTIENTIEATCETLNWTTYGANTAVTSLSAYRLLTRLKFRFFCWKIVTAVCIAFALIIIFIIVSGVLYHRFVSFFVVLDVTKFLSFYNSDVDDNDIEKQIIQRLNMKNSN